MNDIVRFLSVADAAEILGVSARYVYSLITSGELLALRVGTSGPWRIETSQLNEFIEHQYDVARSHAKWAAAAFAPAHELADGSTF